VGIINYMGVGYYMLADVLIFNLEFTTQQLIGATMAVTCSITSAVYKARWKAAQ